MSIQSEAASKFQGDLIRRSDALSRRLQRLWRRVSVDDLDAGWAAIEADVVAAVSAVTVQNASSAGRMVQSVARADGVASGDVIVAGAFAGVDGTGRSSAGLLHGAVTTTKEQIGRGLSTRSAFLSGAAYLAAMSKTLVADLARSSVATASAGRNYVRYVRVVSPGACNRCAILAGSDRFSKPFLRHPACRCTSVPVTGGALPGGVFGSPREYFESLSKAEQDRIFTKAGAEAIRMGADPVQVAGARRGAAGIRYSDAYPAPLNGRRTMQKVQIGVRPSGEPIMGYTTLEGTTKRGVYGRIQRDLDNAGFVSRSGSRYTVARRSRLMPETIMDLTDDVELRRVLLRDAGYLDIPIRDGSSNAWVGARLRQRELDRIQADTFYRGLGIDLY